MAKKTISSSSLKENELINQFASILGRFVEQFAWKANLEIVFLNGEGKLIT